MKENARGGRVLCNAHSGRMVQERKPTVPGHAAQWALMTAGVIVGAVLLVGAVAEPVCAQSYPDQPIRLVLATSPGGTTDIIGRIIAPKLAEQLGQPVVVENRPGAGGNVGAEYVAKAQPDGYTILLANGDMGIAASLYEKLTFDPIKDLTAISLVAQVPLLMSVRPDLPVNNLQELVEYAKANPGKLNYASSGVGAMNHLAVEQLKSLTGINIVHAPYKATGPGLVGLMGGEVDMIVTAFSSVRSQVQAGKIKALAMLSSERSPSMSDVPTAKESGIDDYEFYLWFGILVPAGTPADIVSRLHTAWTKVAALPDTEGAIKKTGCTPLSSTPEAFSEFLEAEIGRWAKIIKEANIPRQ